jgi:hypothetical protein
MTTDAELSNAAVDVEKLLDRIFAELRGEAQEVRDLYSNSGEDGRLSIQAFNALRPGILRNLDDNRAFQGTGFVVNPSAVVGGQQYQEWWLRGPSGRPRRLPLNRDYDYTQRAYFVGASRGSVAVEGPYLDYAGSDHFVLTFAAPVMVGDRFVGLSGADVTISSFERLVTPGLNRVSRPVVLLNEEHRVIASTSTVDGPGDRLATVAKTAVRVGGGIGWSIVDMSE